MAINGPLARSAAARWSHFTRPTRRGNRQCSWSLRGRAPESYFVFVLIVKLGPASSRSSLPFRKPAAAAAADAQVKGKGHPVLRGRTEPKSEALFGPIGIARFVRHQYVTARSPARSYTAPAVGQDDQPAAHLLPLGGTKGENGLTGTETDRTLFFDFRRSPRPLSGSHPLQL